MLYFIFQPTFGYPTSAIGHANPYWDLVLVFGRVHHFLVLNAMFGRDLIDTVYHYADPLLCPPLGVVGTLVMAALTLFGLTLRIPV